MPLLSKLNEWKMVYFLFVAHISPSTVPLFFKIKNHKLFNIQRKREKGAIYVKLYLGYKWFVKTVNFPRSAMSMWKNKKTTAWGEGGS